MKVVFSIILFCIFIHSIDLTYDDEIDQIKNLLGKKFHLQNNDDEDDNGDDDEYIPTRSQHRQSYSSRKKIQNTEDENEFDELKTYSSSKVADETCIDKYELRSEQLVKVKELKDGARMIRFVVLDKRSLPSRYSIKQHCMMNCCAQKACDLAMLSDKPGHDGYKCYLFACNGSCTFATHEDYTVIMPKMDLKLYSNSIESKNSEITTTKESVKTPKRSSFFLDTSVIIFLIFGLISTICLLVFLVRYCRDSLRRGRKNKNYEVDADYLINGLYL